jgi:hypothetical protein
LIRGDTDKHLWAQTYERDFHDILALQDDVASSIAKQIQSKPGGPEPLAIAKPQPISPEAYETYLKANSYLDQFDLQKSIDYYNQTSGLLRTTRRQEACRRDSSRGPATMKLRGTSTKIFVRQILHRKGFEFSTEIL